MWIICATSARSSYSDGIDGRPVPTKDVVHPRQRLIDDFPNFADGMAGRYPAFHVHIAEHLVLLCLIASHDASSPGKLLS